MRSLTAVLALVKGGNAGRSYHSEVENDLSAAANAGLPPPPLPEVPPERRLKRGRKKDEPN